ncbi:MAG: 3-keto-disaccharide hydrolase [Verrucomicrobiaceae bacterium]
MKAFLLAIMLCGPALLHAAEPVTLFNGKDLSNWQIKAKKDKGMNKWMVGEPRLAADTKLLDVTSPEGAMVNLAAKHGDSWDIYSKDTFGSCRIELDVFVPVGSNSGIYVMGEYEVQVFDSFGKAKPGPGDMGAIYGANPPPVNAAKRPGDWQRYVIEFQAPTFDAEGKKTANAKFIKVELNGQVLHENLEMKGPTLSGVTGKEASTGPLMFQGDHGPVAFRNITLTPLP